MSGVSLGGGNGNDVGVVISNTVTETNGALARTVDDIVKKLVPPSSVSQFQVQNVSNAGDGVTGSAINSSTSTILSLDISKPAASVRFTSSLRQTIDLYLNKVRSLVLLKKQYISAINNTLQDGEDSLASADNSVHALTSGDADTGVDSLTGGGSTISNEQSQFLQASARDMGAGDGLVAELAAALKLASLSGSSSPDQLEVNIARMFVTADTGAELTFDAGNDLSQYLLVTSLKDLSSANASLIVQNVDKVIAFGEGSVRVEGSTPTMIIGNGANQVIAGGLGNDTLVGGGGNDTLVGGGGADTFVFNKRGHFTITDFVQGSDKLLFEFDGVSTRAHVMSHLTAITNEGGNTKFHFGTGASITLVGVQASTLFNDLQFDIT